MAENSGIEWTDHTFNPWEGCQHVGPGCDHCYAEARNQRYAEKGATSAPNWGAGAPRRRTSAANWRKPHAWQRNAVAFFAEHGRRQRVFCSSLADVFDNAVDDTWRRDLAHVIVSTPDLDWLLLSKRIGNAVDMLVDMFPDGVPDNVFLGATIVNQEEWDRDQGKIAAASVLVGKARVFLSMEPLLGPVNLRMGRHHFARIVGWVIVGGESGHGARPMHPDWARNLRDQCAAASVPFLFKQWGNWQPVIGIGKTIPRRIFAHGREYFDDTTHRFPDGQVMIKAGKKLAGRNLQGREHNGFPGVLDD